MVWNRQFLTLLTWRCASRHTGVHFFDISSSKSAPTLVCFVHDPTRIGHQADQEMFEYTNYTKPTRIGHQADQERLGYSNYTKPTLLFVRNMPLAVAARDPSTEIPLLGAWQCSCAGSFKSNLLSLDVPRPTKSRCSDLVVCKQHSTSKDDHLTVPCISYG